MAGYIAYSSFLAIFPFLIFAVSLTGVLIGQSQNEVAVETLFAVLPDHIAQTLEPVLHEVLRDRGSGILTVSILVSIWLASNAIEAFRTAFDRAYSVDVPRRGILRRLIAIALVIIGASSGAILSVSILFGPILLQMVDRWLDISIPVSTVALGYLGGVLMFLVFLYLLHRILPSRKMKGEYIWPGIVVSLIIWLMSALGFSIYLSLSTVYTVTYGTLTGVMVTLIFLYLSGMAIIFGAEVNAVINLRDATETPS